MLIMFTSMVDAMEIRHSACLKYSTLADALSGKAEQKISIQLRYSVLT